FRQERQPEDRIHCVQTRWTTHNVRELRRRESFAIAIRVCLLQFLLRQASATTRTKDQLPQVKHQIAIRPEIPDRRSRGSFTIYEPQPARPVDKRFRFTTRESLPLVDAITRSVEDARNLGREVVMEEPENK